MAQYEAVLIIAISRIKKDEPVDTNLVSMTDCEAWFVFLFLVHGT